MNTNTTAKFVFFGSSRLSVIVLDELEKSGIVPAVIVTTPDKPQGRKLELTPNVVKDWAVAHKIPVLDPAKLDQAFIETMKAEVPGESAGPGWRDLDVFIVASYGKIMPEAVIEFPPRKTLNIHPSLLPKYRGAAPLPSAMLDDEKKTGVSIMKLDKEMDHGPIVAQKEVTITEWPTYEDFEELMAREGARLLAEILPGWVAGSIEAKAQDHAAATYTKKIVKEDAEISLGVDGYTNFRKIQAYHAWPTAFFFIQKDSRKLRVKVTAASFKNNKLLIEKVIPEGSREMSYADFLKGYAA